VRRHDKTGGAIGFVLIFLFLFVSRQKERSSSINIVLAIGEQPFDKLRMTHTTSFPRGMTKQSARRGKRKYGNTNTPW
jgi:hypothetical protein